MFEFDQNSIRGKWDTRKYFKRLHRIRSCGSSRGPRSDKSAACSRNRNYNLIDQYQSNCAEDGHLIYKQKIDIIPNG